LTDLPNRRALHEHVRRMLEPPDESNFALVVMDLDQFKNVNDNLGHRIGDRLLLEVAHRLRTCMRAQDFVARLGGDEFALVLGGVSEPAQVAELIEVVRAGLRNDVEYEGIPLSVDGSFGVAIHPHDGREAELLLQRADKAMYRAKATDTSVQFYDEVVDVSKPEWLTLAGQLRRSVEAGELRLVYQPKIELATGDLTGVEALLRWQHPTRGLVGPEEFIRIAERTRTIGEITAWVLDAALGQLAQWDESIAEVPRVAVNISTKSLRYEAALPGTVANLLRRHDIEPHRLMLEITETALSTDDVAARSVLDMLDAMGVKISVDDFGKGYTGIGYLKHMPVSELKIDKDFVVRMIDDRADHAIVRSVVDLAHRLGLECTAEGIETHAQFEELRAIGCERGQGYYISEPLTPEAFDMWMHDHRSRRHDRVRLAHPAGSALPASFGAPRP
jgi:diguanylate cyclase (GGDEF)-like protein